ncbi:MAG: type II toxin-antitoxin system RelE/ParE family toxin [Bacteroidales bacterium]|nr:type II toxin-antitoxin system RelE/ParE family toxin [Bacteroidales bacterium]
MAEYVLSELSKKDLREIGDYTEKTWSEEQAVKYITKLFSQIHLLAENPCAGRAYDEVRKGLRGCHCGKHIIFYRIICEDKIRIVRILHEKMDYPRHF